MKKLMFLALFLLMSATMASAKDETYRGGQVPEKQQVVSPSHRQAAKRLYDVMGVEKTMRQYIKQAEAGAFSALANKSECITPVALQELKQTAQKFVPYREIEAMAVELNARYFTEKELNEIIGFYKSDVGQKARQINPEEPGQPSFSEAEKQQLAAFMQTDVGQKTMRVIPSLVQNVMQRSQAVLSVHKEKSEEALGRVVGKYINADGTCK